MSSIRDPKLMIPLPKRQGVLYIYVMPLVDLSAPFFFLPCIWVTFQRKQKKVPVSSTDGPF